jgi:hypothetical protein
LRNGSLFNLENNNNDKIILDRKNYLLIVNLLNKLINFINKGRKINGGQEIEIFPNNLPSEFEVKNQRKQDEDFFDSNIKKY